MTASPASRTWSSSGRRGAGLSLLSAANRSRSWLPATQAQTAILGATVYDRITVKNLGALSVSVRVELWGPYLNLAAVKCTGTPLRVQTLAITADGTYQTSPYTLDKEVVGVLGVIGPTRMAYERVIPIVDVTARLLGSALNSRA